MSAVTEEKKQEKPANKFRVLRGSHVEMSWVPVTQEDIENDAPGIVKRANGKYYRLVQKTYEAGEEIETNRDLATEFNSRGPLGNRFMKLGGNEQVLPASASPNPWDHLETKTKEQLVAFAVSEEIDLGDVKTKEQILQKLIAIRDGSN